MTINYDRLKESYIIENPVHDDEIALADLAAQKAVEKFLSQLKGPNQRKRALAMLAPQMLASFDRQQERREDDTNQSLGLGDGNREGLV